jgi:hypothetical protein
MLVAKLAAPEMSTARAASPHCEAGELYYTKRNQAVPSPAEWNKVRACAIASADNAVLMMLYANGFGVPRDTDCVRRQLLRMMLDCGDLGRIGNFGDTRIHHLCPRQL